MEYLRAPELKSAASLNYDCRGNCEEEDDKINGFEDFLKDFLTH